MGYHLLLVGVDRRAVRAADIVAVVVAVDYLAAAPAEHLSYKVERAQSILLVHSVL